MDIVLRNATAADIPFVTKVILEAEKSGTEVLTLAKLFNCTVNEVAQQNYDRARGGAGVMVSFSLQSYLLAFANEVPVAGLCGWVERDRELPSAVVRANALHYAFGAAAIEHAFRHYPTIHDIAIPRAAHTLHLEYMTVEKAWWGKGLVGRLINGIIEREQHAGGRFDAIEFQLYKNNSFAIRAYERNGFHIILEKEVKDERTAGILPHPVKLLMRKLFKRK